MKNVEIIGKLGVLSVNITKRPPVFDTDRRCIIDKLAFLCVVRFHLRYEFIYYSVGVFVWYLTGSDLEMTAAAVF